MHLLKQLTHKRIFVNAAAGKWAGINTGTPGSSTTQLTQLATIISGKEDKKLLIIDDLLQDVKERVIMRQNPDKRILKKNLTP